MTAIVSNVRIVLGYFVVSYLLSVLFTRLHLPDESKSVVRMEGV
ncbi:MAG: hypothetical protein WBD47_08055 [Phormidesmis sp.]